MIARLPGSERMGLTDQEVGCGKGPVGFPDPRSLCICEKRVSTQALGCAVGFRGSELWREDPSFGSVAGRAGASVPGLCFHSSAEHMGDQFRNSSRHHLVSPVCTYRHILRS